MEGVAGFWVGRVEHGARHAASQQNLVGVADEAVEGCVVRNLSILEGRVLVRVANGGEASVAPDEVRSEDDPTPVVLEPLRRIDAPDLPEPVRVAGPQCSGWGIS